VVAVSGAVLHGLRLPGSFVVVVQLIVLGVALCWQMTGVPVPLGGAWPRLAAAFADSWASAQQYSAPVPRDAPPIDPLLVAGGAACMLVIDVVVGTMRRAALAGLPLLAIYSVPLAVMGSGVSWVVFALTAVGFLLMLYLQESRHIATWARPWGHDPDSLERGSHQGSGESRRSSAAAIGGVATALAIVAPAFMPHFGVDLPTGGFASGSGGSIDMGNPMIDMNHDLIQGPDNDWLTVHTDDPHPGYLRLWVLNHFADDVWTLGERHPDHPAVGAMPAIPGLAATVPTKTYDYQVQATDDFHYRWLPTQAPISTIDVQGDGDWRYDSSTMDIMAMDDGLTTRGISYSMTAVVPELNAQAMEDAGPATGLPDTFTDVPADLNDNVEKLALDVTRDQPTNFQKAVALQQFFRDGGFQYDKHRPVSNGGDAVWAFLNPETGRRGFCVHFASAMAVMARTLGIPARVAVGFLRPDEVGPGTYVYSAHDLHAWPELYFEGSGWVRFEPTPSDRARTAPRYTRIPVAEPAPIELPSVAPSEDISRAPAPTEAPTTDRAPSTTPDNGSGPLWQAVVVTVAALGLLAALIAMPRAERRRRRQRRTVDDPELVWLELRDTVVDLGLGWPVGRSPRETGTYLARYLGAPVGTDRPERPQHGAGASPEAEWAMERIVSAVELARYGRPGRGEGAGLKADAETVLASIEGGATRSARRRAEWLPRSLFGRRPRDAPAAETRAQDLVGSGREV
jgi:transglutaminase-like putative cysteine protease